MGYLGPASALLKDEPLIALTAEMGGLLYSAILEVCHAEASRDIVVGATLGAVAIGVDEALAVSELALSEGIEEVYSIAVHADA